MMEVRVRVLVTDCEDTGPWTVLAFRHEHRSS
jgi:hypothetical protein